MVQVPNNLVAGCYYCITLLFYVLQLNAKTEQVGNIINHLVYLDQSLDLKVTNILNLCKKILL